MIALIQRCQEASVRVENKLVSQIGFGQLILLGVSITDAEKDAVWLARKVANLRIFSDEAGKMNQSLLDVKGDAMVISQFTLFAEVATGNRPSYTKAARPDKAIPLYNLFIKELEMQTGRTVQTGIFGANMAVSLVNDGPVTVWVESP